MAKKPCWIKDAIPEGRKGRLHRMLGISPNQRIPKTLLKKIHGSGEGCKERHVGKKIVNPTKTGDRKIKITSLMWNRAHLALNVGYPRNK